MTTTEKRSHEGLARIEGPEKITGVARYAADYRVEDLLYGWIVQADIACGVVESVDRGVLAQTDVVAVLAFDNAPRLGLVDDQELLVLQSPRVAYRGQVVALVVAKSPETARDAAQHVEVTLRKEKADTLLRADHPRAYRPEKVNPNFPALTEEGDVDLALSNSDVIVDACYQTPAVHNNPMEPHASIARFEPDGHLVVWDSNQGVDPVRNSLAGLFELAPEKVHVISPHVGGGFGSKGSPRPIVVLAALAARATGRAVKLVATRQEMFSLTGYRTPTIQHVQLGATRDGQLNVVVHEVIEQTSRLREFAEQTAVATRTMYAAPARRTDHHLVALDVPSPSWMRAPGECPGMFALESAMDELAVATGIDPIELRIRNEPDRDPDTGLEYSSRHLVACLREGARRFGWNGNDRHPALHRRGRWYVGSGVAASTYPARTRPSRARVRAQGDGRFSVEVAAADIGTGARTALTMLAAECLGVDPNLVTVLLGDSSLPDAPLAGGSMGTSSWGTAVAAACREVLKRVERGELRADVTADTTEELESAPDLARHAFGAQFVEALVDPATGEVRVPRMVGVFAAGRILNPITARSQFIGGMTMGLSMALFEESLFDKAAGAFVNCDLADYHVAGFGDVGEIDVAWIAEHDVGVNSIGTKGIGEIGIVGTAAAVTNAVWHATGVRIRELPLRPDRVIGAHWATR